MDMYRSYRKHDDKNHFFSLYRYESSDDHCMDTCETKDNRKSCVRDVLKAILHAQKEIEKQKMEHRSSCKSCFDDLFAEKKKEIKKNTIPFILYGEDYKPFKAIGVKEYTCQQTKQTKLSCLSSYIFKIKELDGNCAVLELLVFKNDHRTQNVCCQINHMETKDLVSTGICMTVDLSCFFAVSCLPAACLH